MGLHLCAVCDKDASKVCACCRDAHYCGVKCQREHWAEHKPTCLRLPACMQGVRYVLFDSDDDYTEADSPLIQECIAETVGEADHPNHFFCLKNSAKHQLRARLKSIAEHDGGVIKMSCSVWCQLYLIASSPDFETVGFGLCSEVVWQAVQATGSNARMRPGYYCLSDSEVHMRSSAWLGAERGQWLEGPDNNDRFVGLSKDGPRRLTLLEWHGRIVDDIKVAARDDDMPLRNRQNLLKYLEDGAFAFDEYAMIRIPKRVPEAKLAEIKGKMREDRQPL